jgi:RHS repeat-associated protein
MGTDTYAYDDSDNRTRVNEANGAGSLDRYYCYDAVDRVISTRSSSGCNSGLIESYAYDDSGNRTSAAGVTFGYSGSGQLTSCAPTCGTVAHDTAGRLQKWNGWVFEYDAEGRITRACQSTSDCSGLYNELEFTYDGDGHRTQLKKYDTGNGTAVATWDFRYQGDALVEEKLTDGTHSGVVVRSYVVDESGSVIKMTIPAGEPNPGTYLVTWNGHGDALGLWQIDLSTGALTLANSYTYGTWGQPATATANGFPDLGFRFLYVGEFDVQWDNLHGLGLFYMHARHYSPALGRFLQPDPDGSEDNLYAYTANNPVTEIDPDGTCFIVCQLIVGAIIDTAIYLATTDSSQWSVAGAARAVVGGAVESAINPFAKIGRVAKLASAAGKILSKIPRAARAVNHVGRSVQLARWTRSASRQTDRAIRARDQGALVRLGAYAGDARMAVSRGPGARLGRGNIIDGLVKGRARGSRFFRDTTITRRGQGGVDFDAPGIFRGRRTYDITTKSMASHHRARWPGVRLFFT